MTSHPNIIEEHKVGRIDQKTRLQEYARGIFKTIPSRSGIKKAIKRGDVLLDGKPANTGDWIESGQRISLLKRKAKEQRKVFTLNFPVIYEDDFLALIDKPAGYPCSGNYFKTIEHALPHNLKKSPRPDALPYPMPVHRLDNPTSGLLLIAKTIPVNAALNLQFENGKVEKNYWALVEKAFPDKEIIDLPIDGKPAKTRILKNTYTPKNNRTQLKLEPITGRTHQLRIHLSEEGYPILGDLKYGSQIEYKKGIALRASGLKFIHPVLKETLVFQ